MNFDENGKRIPIISKADAEVKIRSNLIEYNADVKAHNKIVRKANNEFRQKQAEIFTEVLQEMKEEGILTALGVKI